jgi:hypothetical protein
MPRSLCAPLAPEIKSGVTRPGPPPEFRARKDQARRQRFGARVEIAPKDVSEAHDAKSTRQNFACLINHIIEKAVCLSNPSGLLDRAVVGFLLMIIMINAKQGYQTPPFMVS